MWILIVQVCSLCSNMLFIVIRVIEYIQHVVHIATQWRFLLELMKPASHSSLQIAPADAGKVAFDGKLILQVSEQLLPTDKLLQRNQKIIKSYTYAATRRDALI